MVAAEYPHNALWDALRTVPDPEMAISIVDMGLVVGTFLPRGTGVDVIFFGHRLHFSIALSTKPACDGGSGVEGRGV